MAFRILIVAFVQATNKYYYIGIFGFLDSLIQQFFFRARFVKTAPNGDTIVALHRVTHVAAGIVDLCITEARLDTVEWQNLLLHFKRRGATAHGHHFNGVFAHHKDALFFGCIQW